MLSAKYNGKLIVGGLLLFCTSAFAPAQDEEFTLKLTDTDLRSLITLVSLQTGTTFVVDPRVQGTVNVVSHAPVTQGTLYEIFLSVLQIHGFAAIPSGAVTKIVPDVVARKGAIPLDSFETAKTGDQLVSQVIQLRNISAINLAPALRAMVPQEGLLEAVPESNSLIITDRRSNIQRLENIITSLDQSQKEDAEIISLNHASASELSRLLSDLRDNSMGSSAIRLAADDRSNSLIVSGSRAARDRTRKLVASLDVPLASNRNTRVVALDFADAVKIAAILRDNAKGAGSGQQAQAASTPQLSSRGIMPGTIPGVQQNGEGQPPLPDIPPNFSVPNQAVAAPVFTAVDGRSQTQITADPDTNSIIITGSADQIAANVDIIKLLDVRRAQVQVEAVIAEITEDSISELGVNFLAANREFASFTSLGDGTENALGLAGAVQSGQLPQALDTGLSLAVGRAIDGGFNFSLLLRALKSDSDNNILSTPTIVTLDNEEAEIVVGSNVPFVTGQQLSANNDNPFQTIERQDVGLRLKVKPQINEDNTIKLTLEQEVSSVNPTAVNGAVDITTSQRSLKTTVLVDDGQSLVLGGLIDEVLSDSEEKVPLLGDIPIIGNLFRHKVKSKRKTNLVIFLKPNIMRDKKAAIRLSEQHINKTGFASEIDRRRYGTLHSEGGEIQPNANSQLGEVTWKSMPDGSMQLIKLR